MKRNDSGYILPMTLVTITLMAFAALLTGRTFGVQLRASMQERLIIEERLTSRNAEHIMDAWMANPEFSKDITTGPVDSNGWQETNPLDPNDPLPVWRTPDGTPDPDCPSPPNTTCWKFNIGPTTSNPLRGGEALQETRDITVEIRSGCVGDIERCQRTTEATRTYERAVFAQYQLHYESNYLPEEALNGPDGIADPADCRTSTPADPSLCDRPNQALDGPDGLEDPADCLTATPADASLCDGPRIIVFTSADTLNGPLRYSGNDKVLYCGSPTFKLIESKSSSRPTRAAVGCPSQPSWMLDDGTTRQWPLSDTDPLDADRFVVQGDELALPVISAPTGCALSTVNYDHNIDLTAKNLRQSNPGTCPGAPGQPDHAILDGDIIVGDTTVSNGDVTIERLCMDGSATIYSERDIIVRGDIKASGPNDADGPNVVALIAERNVILDPSSGTPPECSGPPDTNLTLTNVAILAPNGAVYAREWYLLCGGTCPNFTLEGSIAAKHLGLYGIPDATTGNVTNGWSKHFTYPTDDPATNDINESFWRVRPPWWPGYDSYPIPEWEPA